MGPNGNSIMKPQTAKRLTNPGMAFGRTLIGGVAGVSIAYAFLGTVFLYTLLRFGYHRSLDWNFLPGPATVGVLFAAAAFATYFPAQPKRYLPTLGIIAVFSYCAWMLLMNTEITPRRFKGVEHPAMYFSEAVVMFGPPIFISLMLACDRVYHLRYSSPSE